MEERADRLTRQKINRSNDQPTNQPTTNQSVSQSVTSSINPSIHQSIVLVELHVFGSVVDLMARYVEGDLVRLPVGVVV